MVTFYSKSKKCASVLTRNVNFDISGVSCVLILDDGTLITGGIRENEIRSWKTIPILEEMTSQKLPEAFGLPKVFRKRGLFRVLKLQIQSNRQIASYTSNFPKYRKRLKSNTQKKSEPRGIETLR